MVEVEQQEDVRIFWDLESTISSHASASVGIYEVVRNVRAAVSKYGPLKSYRAYWDYTGHFSATRVRSELSSSGVTLIDCPGDGRKGAAMKKLLVDMVLHAWDHPVPQTYIIITNDRDSAYAISMLRTRHFRVVLMCPAGTHADLTSQASSQLDWTRGVLGLNGDIVDDHDDFDDMSAAPQATPGPSVPHPTPSTPSYPSTAPAHNGFPFPSRFRRGTMSGLAHDTELSDFPPRGRRNSTLSKSFEPRAFSPFGDLANAYPNPLKAMASFGLGEGPLFPRSQSNIGRVNPSRADSAPPNMVYSSMTQEGAPYPSIGDLEAESVMSRSKGKQRDFPLFEPEEIAPQASFAGTRVPYSGSVFEPFGEDKPLFKNVMTVSRPKASSRKSSFASQASSHDSTFSMIHHIEPSTAPTSAEQEADPKLDDLKSSQALATITVNPAPAGRSVGTLPPARNMTENSALDVDSDDSSVAAAPQAVDSQSEKAIQASVPTVTEPKPSSSAPPPSVTPPPLLPPAFRPFVPASPAPPPKSIAQPARPRAASQAPALPRQGSASTSIQPPGTPTVAPPAPWAPLVTTLRRAGGSMVWMPLSAALIKTDPKAIQAAGVAKFKTYIFKATNAGIVIVTGADNNKRVQLTPRYAV